MPKVERPDLFDYLDICREAEGRGKPHLAAAVFARRMRYPCPFTRMKGEPMPPKSDTVLHIDLETRSRVDLAEAGQDVYARDDSTEILVLCYAIGDGPTQTLCLWSPDSPQDKPEMPADIWQHIECSLPVCAHNAAFEAALWEHICVARWGWSAIPAALWRDTMALAGIRALPQSLGKCAEALGLPMQKDDKGRRVMLKWCKPRKPTKTDPSEWAHDAAEYEVLCEYCAQDVEVERQIWHKLGTYWPDHELAVFRATWNMNQRGIPIDLIGAAACKRIMSLGVADWEQRLAEATGGKVTPELLRSRKEFLDWLATQGTYMQDVQGPSLTAALKRAKTPAATLALQARIALGRTSTAKVESMLARTSADGVTRGCFVYHGATTGRWTARGIQPQNMPRDSVADVDACLADAGDMSAEDFSMIWGEPGDAVAGCLRGLICAPEGHTLVASDYSQIEARVLLWLAGDEKNLALFAKGADIYKDMAADIYETPADQVTKDQRMLGKVAILGLGYGMGKNKFYETCQNFGLRVPPEICDAAVDKYRKRFAKVKRYWYAIEAAAVAAVEAGTCKTEPPRPIAMLCKNDELRIKLPSGRLLFYQRPSIETGLTPWGEEKPRLCFYGVNQQTKQWQKQDTYGGKLVENICQAVARDIMARALVEADRSGLAPVMTVHDEIVCSAPSEPDLPARLDRVMLALPQWAAGLPLACESWAAQRYRK